MKRTIAAVLFCAVLIGVLCLPFSASSGSLVSIEVVKGPDKSEYIVGEHIDLRGTVVKLTYDNGDVVYETLEEAANSDIMDNYYYGDEYKFISPGRRDIEISRYGEVFATVSIYVSENKAERLEISNGDGKELLLNLYNSDGTVTNMKALDLELYDGVGQIATDNGIFDISFYTLSDGSVYAEIVNESTGETLRSNTISECHWYTTVNALHEYVYDLWFYNSHIGDYGAVLSEFDGVADEDSIDGLITYVLRHHSPEVISSKCLSEGDSGWSYEYVYNAKDVAEIIEEVFGVSDVEVTGSYRYDGETGYLKNEEYMPSGGFGGFMMPRFPFDIKQLGNKWVFAWNREGTMSMYLELNEDLQIRYFNYLGYRRGDINSDYAVNITDLFALKGALVNGGEASGAVDVNGDYNVNISDLFELKGLLCG